MISKGDFSRKFEGWHIYNGFYGKGETVTSVFRLPNVEKFHFGVGINIGFEGNYQLRISKSDGKIFAMILKRQVCVPILAKTELTEIKDNVVISLENSNGMLLGIIDGIQMLSAKTDNSFTSGYCGTWIYPESCADCLIDFSCNGQSCEPIREQEREDLPKAKYFDDFSDLKSSKWYIPPDSFGFNIEEKDDKSSLCSLENKLCRQELFVFENNPTVSFKFSISSVSESSAFAVFLRHSPQTAFIKIEYNFSNQCFSLTDCPAKNDCKSAVFLGEKILLENGKNYQLKISAIGDNVIVFCDDTKVLDIKPIRHIGYGKIGLLSDNLKLVIDDFFAELPSGQLPESGISFSAVSDKFVASMELEELPNGNLLGITKKGNYLSDSEGLSFKTTNEYDGCLVNGFYQSVHRLDDGTYLQVLLCDGMKVQTSPDMKEWTTVGRVIPKDELENNKYIFHTSSITQMHLSNGKTRLFLPIAIRTAIKNEDYFSNYGHNTLLYFSDDLGHSWKKSETTAYDTVKMYPPDSLGEFSEMKVVPFGENKVKMYCSRSRSKYMLVFSSEDGGEHFSAPEEMHNLKCPLSSFAVCEDRYNPGTYYMVYVNDDSAARGSFNFRTRLSLLRSKDGVNWKYICDVERNGIRFADEMKFLYSPLFQILDPCILATKEYLFVSFGLSDSSAQNASLSNITAIHQQQHVQMVRLTKADLKEKDYYCFDKGHLPPSNETESEVKMHDIY